MKILMYEFSYLKPKYSKKAKLCYMDTGIKAADIRKEITENIRTRFDTTYELERLLPKKVTKLMNKKFGGKIIIKFVGLTAKTVSKIKQQKG